VTQPICCSDDKPLESLDRLPMAYAFSQLSHDAFQLASIQRTWDLKHVQGTGISELLSFGPSPLYRILHPFSRKANKTSASMRVTKLRQKREQHADNSNECLCNPVLARVFALCTTTAAALAVAIHRHFGVTVARVL
jgi:hypothetical protein